MKAILLVVLALSSTVLFAQTYEQPDLFIGNWMLNTQRSKYASNDLPKRMVIVMEPSAQGVHYRSETQHQDGHTTVAQYTAAYDGNPAIVVSGSNILAPVTLKRIDANTVKASYVRGLQVVATSLRVLSHNGSLLTITTTSKDIAGRAVTNVGTYDRVQLVAAQAGEIH